MEDHSFLLAMGLWTLYIAIVHRGKIVDAVELVGAAIVNRLLDPMERES